MAHQILDLLRGYLVHYGYWAVAVALLLETAGLPVPGETVLLLASFLAYSQHELSLANVILVGIIAATIGDNIGFALGVFGGRRLLDRYRQTFRISAQSIQRAETFFERFGAAAIFFARFIFGMRVIAGPLAGVLRMNWRKFVLFNLLGAVLWVTVISTAGFLFGRHWDLLVEYMRRADIALIVLILIAIYFWWRRNRVSRGSRLRL
jgi:membrane protein DedA with SNARE-associated domain